MVRYESLISDHQHVPFAAPLTWAQAVENIPGVLAINKDTLSFLPRILGRFDGVDPYMMCPSYHAFTGRYGLWAYYKGRSLLLMARNPANQEQILFFPQLGDPVPHLALDIIDNVQAPEGGYRFARIPTEQAGFMAAILNKRSKQYSFDVIREDLLDWTYPVHVISTEKVINPAGRQMKNFRLRMAKIDQARVTVKPFNSSSDIPELMSIVDKWAKSKAPDLDYDEMIEIYSSLFDLVLHPALDLMGIKIYYDGELKAYEIWDMPKEQGGIANSFAGFSDAQVCGFSEFQHYALCKALHDVGIKEVCLGGSEVEGLDAFKRKMRPVRSIDLSSIEVRPRFTKILRANIVMRYSLNDTVDISGYPASRVVGIDKYTLRSLTGRLKQWTSYTLVSEDESLRWWLSDENAGLYCWLSANVDQVKGEIDLTESGLCKLEIEGDSTVSSPYSSVLFYRNGDEFYSLEAFDGDDEVFSMIGKIIK